VEGTSGILLGERSRGEVIGSRMEMGMGMGVDCINGFGACIPIKEYDRRGDNAKAYFMGYHAEPQKASIGEFLSCLVAYFRGDLHVI